MAAIFNLHIVLQHNSEKPDFGRVHKVMVNNTELSVMKAELVFAPNDGKLVLEIPLKFVSITPISEEEDL